MKCNRGPIVQGFYEMALLSWHMAFSPSLPLLSRPPQLPTSYRFGDENEFVRVKDIERARGEEKGFLREYQGVQKDDQSECF